MTLIIKTIVIVLFIFILISLGSALYFLIHDKGQQTRMVKALTWRIALSLVLFILLFVAFALGWIAPHPPELWR